MNSNEKLFEDNSEQTEAAEQRKILFSNNLRAVVIFAVIFAVNYLFLFLGGLGFIVGNIMSVILFVSLGYKYLNLTEKNTWMSVSLLTVVFAAAFALGYLADFVFRSETGDSFLPFILGLPIVYPADGLRLFVLIPLGIVADSGGGLPPSAIFYNSLMTIFLPPLLIYSGLRMKVRKQRKVNLENRTVQS